ncbi:DUF3037 domain-containing protein [Paenibacillus glacialis]|uniref:DUF3037 domain-containing protein n=1 Tax=Paenibacillus glacialis TaxID=494026 RepID=A0A168DDZ4_9BACL|nr:DUF3037 domain-containing protein [Paenibacillus glacialis]OAB34109.1 hypothetical protein PGLA_24745 [Paenibacillus glacialis]
MDNKLCKYTVLRYVPDENREEFINIGVVLHSPEDKYIDCIITTNFSRVSVFDDEIDIPFLKIVLSGVKEDFSKNSMVSGPSYEDLADKNYLEKATSIYINQLQFSKINLFRSSDFDTDLFNLYKVYVHFEVQKKSRLTDQEVKSIMNKVIRTKTHNLDQSLEKNLKFDIGSEQIELDYAYKTKKKEIKIIKTFSFDYTLRGSKQAAQLAKEWAYNFNKLKSKDRLKEHFETNNVDLTSLVYIKDLTKNVKIALEILKEETKTFEVHNHLQIEDFADQMVDEMTGQSKIV